MNSKSFIISLFLISLICVILSVSVTAAPAPLSPPTKRNKDPTDPNDPENLLSDSNAVKSSDDGIGIEAYNPDDKTPKDVVKNGNSAEGDNSGFK